jgi:hypothetical protein
MWDELENALAWYAAAPSRWVGSAKQDLSAAAEWIWTVLQGDFAEEQSTAQTITGTVISMIPFVDQLCDVRDIVANCRKIDKDGSDKWAWVALVLTLLGLFPTLGSLAKGCFKILLAYGRKGVVGAGAKALESGLWKATSPWVERGIQKLNEFLARPEVRKTLATLKIDNPYKYLAAVARDLAGQMNTAALLKVMDGCTAALKDLVGLVQKWGSAAMKTQAGEVLQSVARVREQANRKLADVLQPVQHWLDHLARRLEVEADMNYRAYTNAVNPHSFARPSLAAEIDAMRRDPPAWVDRDVVAKYKALDKAPAEPGWPDISKKAKGPLNNAAGTFHSVAPIEIPPGTVLYRVVDPGSFDNSVCWMSKAEFDKLMSKNDWRRRFAVWVSWNRNGEYVTYTVPSGKPLRAWEGVTATQEIRDGREVFSLEGGARQIVVDPKDLDKSHVGKRQPTNWGYNDLGESLKLVGVPVLKNNWKE